MSGKGLLGALTAIKQGLKIATLVEMGNLG
jgi:hypothetical protein